MPSPAANDLPTTDRSGARDGSGLLSRATSARARQRDSEARSRHRDTDLAPTVRRILHLDVDAFLASVEQAVHPELCGLPLVVGGLPHERNLVMSCSYVARAHGIRPGMLLAEAARRCPAAVFVRGDSQAANRLRQETAAILMRFTPTVEVASIDDFFADLTGLARLQGAATDVAQRMRAAIASELALPVTIGIGTNRLLARLAGKLAKPGGIAEILPGHEESFLSALPIGHLPGAGHVIQRRLASFGLRTVGDLALVSREVLYASFGHAGLVLYERARGIDREPVEATYTAAADGTWIARLPRTIRRDSTFEPEEGRREYVEAMLCYLVERAAHRLRAQRASARSIAVRLIYVDTRPPGSRRAAPDAGLEFERSRNLGEPTDSTHAVWQAALEILRALPRRRALVKRIGLTLAHISATGGWQGHLFSAGDAPAGAEDGAGAPTSASHAERMHRIDRALDRMRAKHGFGRMLLGTSFTLKATHALQRDGFQLRTPSLNQ
jgi:DNA polymerase-4